MHAPVWTPGEGVSRAYRDPSRIWGSGVVIAGLIFIALVQYKPWEHDWESVRMLFGGRRTVPIAGRWEVVQMVAVDPDQTMLIPARALMASFDFDPSGFAKLKVELKKERQETTGSYRQNGDNLVLAGLRPISKGAKAPPMITLKLSWTGDDEVVASVGRSQTLYLRRLNAGDQPGPVAGYRAMGGRMVRWP